MGAVSLNVPKGHYPGTGDSQSLRLSGQTNANEFWSAVIPVDLCTDQILALTAATVLKGSNKQAGNTMFGRGESVQVYHATLPEAAMSFDDLNAKSFKAQHSFVSAKTLLDAYEGIFLKHIVFPATKARAGMATLDLQGLITQLVVPTTLGAPYFAAIRAALNDFMAKKMAAAAARKRKADVVVEREARL